MILRILGLMVTLLLVGCGGLYRGSADLSVATSMVQPIPAGWYVAPDNASTRTKFERVDDGTYRLLNPISSEELIARVFGPVSGLYVAQIIPDPTQRFEYGYAIIRVDNAGIHVANDASDLMGELLFDRLGVSAPAQGSGIYLNPSRVTDLTDNAYLNWALLQELIIKHREKLVFELHYAVDK